jgi:hypothetical protein
MARYLYPFGEQLVPSRRSFVTLLGVERVSPFVLGSQETSPEMHLSMTVRQGI